MNRKLFLATSISSALTACSPIGTALNNNAAFHKFLGAPQSLDHLIIGTRGLAHEYSDADVMRDFPLTGLPTPANASYQTLLASDFANYKLIVDGAVANPQTFSLGRFATMQHVAQITRHDCVEGWSAIGKWAGVRLRDVIAIVQPLPIARYAIFHCMDQDDQGTQYYESLDIAEAMHPQALLATSLNDSPLPPDHGAPVRLKVPTQLGYKSAKWVSRIEFAPSFGSLAGGKGGYWEDQGYEWYAGI